MDNIKYHIKEAENKLEAAKSLLENGFYKDSTSRSYYSMHHAARAILLMNGISPKTHRGVITEFGLEFVKKDLIEKYYSKALAKGKDVREIADYDIIVEITEKEAESIIKDADRFLIWIKEAIKNIRDKSKSWVNINLICNYEKLKFFLTHLTFILENNEFWKEWVLKRMSVKYITS